MAEYKPGRPLPDSLAHAAERINLLLEQEQQRKLRQRNRLAGRPVRSAEAQQDEADQKPKAATRDSPYESDKETYPPLDGRAPRGDVNQASRIEHLRMLARQRNLSDASRQAGQNMAANLMISDRVRTVDAEREKALFDALVNDPVVADASVTWHKGTLGGPTSDARADVIRRILAHHAHVYEHQLPEFRFEYMAPDTAGTYRDGTIRINPAYNFYHLPLDILNSSVHESRHAYQWDLINELESGLMKVSDPRYPLAEALRLNDKFYNSPETNMVAYDRQPKERHARALHRVKDNPDQAGYAEPLNEAFRAMWRIRKQ